VTLAWLLGQFSEQVVPPEEEFDQFVPVHRFPGTPDRA
jgi:hypothetical protein